MSSPFKRSDTKTTVGYTLAVTRRLRRVVGDIGLEIEVEGNKFQKEVVPSPWAYHKDNSLRGQDNAEYVLQRPISFDKVPEEIAKLWKMFSDYGSVLDDSNRTSVHVHLNVQNFHLNRLTAFVALYLSVEEILTQWCGDHRVGNLFCLRGKDAPALVSLFKDFVKQNGSVDIRDNWHYSGMNLHALSKFGSLEFRTMRGVTDPQVIIDWVSILRHIYDLSAKFPDPREIPSLLSGEGVDNYLSMVVGPKVWTVLHGISSDFTTQRVHESLYEGIRLAQDVCYSRDWSLFQVSELKDDPFDRDVKRVSAEIEALADFHNSQHGGPAPAPMTFQPTQGWAQIVEAANVPMAPLGVETEDY